MLSEKRFAFEIPRNERVGLKSPTAAFYYMKDQILQLADHLSTRQTVPDGIGQLASNAIDVLHARIIAATNLVSEPSTRAVLVDFANLLSNQSTQLKQNTLVPDWTLFFRVVASLEATGDRFSINTASMIREFANSQRSRKGQSNKSEEPQFFVGILFIALGMAFFLLAYLNSANDPSGGGWFGEIVGALVFVVTIIFVATSGNGGP